MHFFHIINKQLLTYAFTNKSHYIKCSTTSLDTICPRLICYQNLIMGRTFFPNQKKSSISHPTFWILYKIYWHNYLVFYYIYHWKIDSKTNYEIINCKSKRDQVRNSSFISISVMPSVYQLQILYHTISVFKNEISISRQNVFFFFYNVFLISNYKKYLLNLYQLFSN